MQDKTRLRWRSVKPIAHLPHLPVYEAKVKGGIYRVAPTEYIDAGDGRYNHLLRSENDRLLSYVAYFIPDGLEAMMAEDREGLARAEEAKAIAQRDYDASGNGSEMYSC